MKHNPKIVAILILMFLVTQFIGLYVVNYYLSEENSLPYGLETPEIESDFDYYPIFSMIIFAFIFAFAILFLLTKFDLSLIMRIWFFIVVILALGISVNTLTGNLKYSSLIALIIAVPLAYFKIFKREIYIHNLTELFIYPGVAAVFVPLLNFYTVFALLILISIYDMWAVWKSGIMQKMAKYQIQSIGVMAGFFVPHLTKKQKIDLGRLKKSERKNKKIKANVAILGGGDVIFPIITAGVMLNSAGLFGVSGIYSAISVIIGAALGLLYLFLKSEKKKFYPAMPFITLGILVGLAGLWIITRLI
ncbi:hypothetical protein K9L16_01870 [Candidatus Pacearchaeota archaeon]|nr:hypothetical protein [Candidatus Pacearchaeota archaeon]